MIIECNRTSIERSRYLYRDNEVPIVAFDAERFELEFVFLDRLPNPALDGIFSTKFLSVVTDKCIVRKAGKNRFYIVPVACIDVVLNDSRQFDVYDNCRAA